MTCQSKELGPCCKPLAWASVTLIIRKRRQASEANSLTKNQSIPASSSGAGALSAYVDAMERGFGTEVDYGQVSKTYSFENLEQNAAGRYSPAEVVKVENERVLPWFTGQITRAAILVSNGCEKCARENVSDQFASTNKIKSSPGIGREIIRSDQSSCCPGSELPLPTGKSLETWLGATQLSTTASSGFRNDHIAPGSANQARFTPTPARE